MHNPYQVFHSEHETLRKRIHVVLVRSEQPGNVGSIARALMNMGVDGELRIVGSRKILTEQCRAMAVHAQERLDGATFYTSSEEAIRSGWPEKSLRLAATARVGSAGRPHPLWARPAIEKAIRKLVAVEITDLVLVFGPESDGLTNEEVGLCDWVVTIPSVPQYRSLNLAQAVLIFCYEANHCLLAEPRVFKSRRPSQKEKLVSHIIGLAEEAGFVLPGDPFKMKPRLEALLSPLPPSIKDVSTLHGLIDQVSRSLKAGRPAYKGRYRRRGEEAQATKEER